MKRVYGAALLLFVLVSFQLFQSGPGLPNKNYAANQESTIISQNNSGRAISAVVMHNGYLFVPLGADNGGGQGAGAFKIYDVSDLENIKETFSSLDYIDRYQNTTSPHYVGDWAEIHSLPIVDGKYFVISERSYGNAGIAIFDPTNAYDEDSTTLPEVISKHYYPGVSGTTNYDGYSFSLASYGGKYVYSPTGANGLFITDISDIENPVHVNHIPIAQLGNLTVRAATVIGNWLLLYDSQVDISTDVLIMDLSNPIEPLQIGKIENIPIGYQPIIYGSEFFPIDDGPLLAYDFSQPDNITVKNYNQFAGDFLFKPEYGFGKDDFLFIGHYPGMAKWSLTDIDAPVVSRVQPINPAADDYAFITPLGNAIAVCSDHNHNNKLNFGIHDVNADVLPPAVKFVVPKDGATNVSTQNGFGISFSDFVDAQSLDTSTLYLTKLGSGTKVTGTYSQMFGFVNFFPNEELENNSTYQIVLAADGVKDWVGNAASEEQIVASFSTGSGILLLPELIADEDKLVNSTVNFQVDTSGIGMNAYTYAIDFGDGSALSPYTSSTSIEHVYTMPGNYTVTLNIKLDDGTIVQKTNVQTIFNPLAEQLPLNSSTIVTDENNNLVWNVNPDNHSVSAINTNTLTKQYEIVVGKQPKTLALAPNNQLLVVNKSSNSISIINRGNGNLINTVAMPYGSLPRAIVVDEENDFAYVSLEAKNQVLQLSLPNLNTIKTLDVLATPGNLALDKSNGKLYVNHFISPDDAGKVSLINTSDFTLSSVIDLAIDTSPDSETNGRGLPNYLGALSISPDLTQAFVPSKKDNIQRGEKRDGESLTFEHTVRSIASQIDLSTGAENIAQRIDFDNDDFATAAAYSPNGSEIYVTTNGTNRMYVIDAYDTENRFSIDTRGLAPDGIAVNSAGNRIYVHNFMSRSVTVMELYQSCENDCGVFQNVSSIDVVANEILRPKVLRGKQLFYNSVDTRLAQDGYMSCASCHLDGGNDGRVWDISVLGEGFRNTIDLRSKQSMAHGLLHWTGNFDELQDFENQIRFLNNGEGLLTDEDFAATEHPLNMPKKTGRSADLDALAAYVASLSESFESPYTDNGQLTAQAIEGKALFEQKNCANCHGTANFTNSDLTVQLYDIGTIKPTSGKRLDENLEGFDAPTLRNLWLTSPYLHDGSAPTVKDAIAAHNNVELNDDELDKLAAYVLQIDDNQCLVQLGATCDDGNPLTENDKIDSNCVCKGELIECTATGNVLYEQWTNISGKTVEDLTSSNNYPNNPDYETVLTNLFEMEKRAEDQFGTVLSGILCAPASGKYKFYIAGNDAAELYLSTDESIGNASKIAFTPASTLKREWEKYTEQASEAIELVEGRQYYLYAIQKEGNGNDHVAVGWKLPSGKQEFPMRTDYFSLPTRYQCAVTYLSDIEIASAENGLGPVELDQSNGEDGIGDGNIITINGDSYDKGLGVHSFSRIKYAVNKNYNRFSTYFGMQDHCVVGAVKFSIKGDGQNLYQSGDYYYGSPTMYIDLDIAEVDTLELIVFHGLLFNYCDHANWADAKLTNCNSCEPGTACDDGDSCTVNDLIDVECNCVGTFLDADDNGVCDLNEVPTNVVDAIAESIQLYPNPATDVLNIRLSKTIEIECAKIYDMQGKQVKQFSMHSAQTSLDIADLSNGQYVLQLFGEFGSISRTLVKQ